MYKNRRGGDVLQHRVTGIYCCALRRFYERIGKRRSEKEIYFSSSRRGGGGIDAPKRIRGHGHGFGKHKHKYKYDHLQIF